MIILSRFARCPLTQQVSPLQAWASDDDFPPVLQLDFGAALSEAATVKKGSVYTREYERATVSLDCNTWSSSFELKSGE